MSREKRLLLLTVSLLSALVYVQTLTYEFVYDDKPLIVENPIIKDIKHLPELLYKEDTLDEVNSGYWRPLIPVGYMLDYFLWGANPLGFHLSNVLLHVLTVALVFLLSLRVLGDPASAFISALFFGLHPINTESVAFISARNNILCALFVVWAFIAALKYRESGRASFLFMSLISFSFALLSKEFAVMFPFFLMWKFSAEEETFKKKLLSLSPFFIVLSAYLALRGIVLKGVVGTSLNLSELPDRLAGSLLSIAAYLRLTFFPIGQKALYDAQPLRLAALIVPVVLLVLILAAVALNRKKQWVIFPAIWFFLFLAPVMNFIPVSGAPMAERYMYVPLIGASLFAGKLLAQLSSKPFGRAATAVCLSALAILTMLRNPVWRNDETLYKDMIKTTPASYKGYYNLGNAMHDKGNLQEAERLWSKVLEVRPDMMAVRNNLGVLYEKRGDYKNAENQYRAILAVRAMPEVYGNLGNALAKQKKYGEAEEAYAKSIAMAPKSVPAYISLAELYESIKRPDMALEVMQGAIKNIPDSYTAYNTAGTMLVNMGRFEEAGRYFEKALSIDPGCYECGYNIELLRGIVGKK